MKKAIGVIAMMLLALPAMANISIQDDFTDGTYAVTVKSTVEDVGGQYKYSYTILPTSTADVQWFSVSLLPGVVITDWGVEAGSGQPFAWTPVGLPSAISVDALFAQPIVAGTTSATLWFTSPSYYTITDGAASGLTGGQYVFVTGDVLTPIPEPATLTILLGGMLLGLCKRK